jgi:hypothetical protein
VNALKALSLVVLAVSCGVFWAFSAKRFDPVTVNEFGGNSRQQTNPTQQANAPQTKLDPQASRALEVQALSRHVDVAPTPPAELPVNDGSTTGKAYQSFQAKQYLAALQLFDSARSESVEANGFFGELLEFCSPHARNQASLDRHLQNLRRQITPTTDHEIWLAIKRYEICRNYQSSPRTEQDTLRFIALNDRRRAEIGPVPPSEQLRTWRDSLVIKATTVEQLWKLADGSFAGAIGAEYFGVSPTRRTNNEQNSASLSRAQTIAIMRLRCDLTKACGPEQLDSILVCAR